MFIVYEPHGSHPNFYTATLQEVEGMIMNNEYILIPRFSIGFLVFFMNGKMESANALGSLGE